MRLQNVCIPFFGKKTKTSFLTVHILLYVVLQSFFIFMEGTFLYHKCYFSFLLIRSDYCNKKK